MKLEKIGEKYSWTELTLSELVSVRLSLEETLHIPTVQRKRIFEFLSAALSSAAVPLSAAGPIGCVGLLLRNDTGRARSREDPRGV